MVELVVLNREILESALRDQWPAEEIERAAELLVRGGGRFPSGIQSLPKQLVKEVQRERVLAAMLKVTAELGYRATNVQDALDRSGVSRPTFYQHFANKEDCFLMALDWAVSRLRNRVEAVASAAGDDWRDRLRVGQEELLRLIAVEPETARALIVEARTAGSAALLRRDALLDRFARWIDGEARAGLANPPSALAGAAVAGGIEAVLYSRINNGENDLRSLLPSLMYFAVLPYAGARSAAEELRGAHRGR